MARKLADKELVLYQKYQELKLTDKGRMLAMNVLRKHRLWETFLHRTFNLSLHEIHREAELLEHQTSDFLAEKIDGYLGNPQFDPHGDPIPDTNGQVQDRVDEEVLSKASPEGRYLVSRLSSSEKEFFDFCRINSIRVGSSIEVLSQYPKNRMTEIKTEQGRILLNHEISSTIFVKPVNEKDLNDE
jgi:DtxR family Mn-dependent transcriptional regulator